MYDVLIIGCGVTGAAAAFELSRYRLRVGIVERENDVALGTTKANSAILHAGYDPEPGTLMARLNVRGVELARELCQKLDVPYRPCGSLVLAFSEEERPTLEELYRRGAENGVPGLELLSGGEARTTNNRMELTGVIAALEALKEPCIVELYSDSKYVIDGLGKGWAKGWRARGWIKSDKKPALNPDLWGTLLDLCEVHQVRTHWVKGHAENPFNNRCDQLAVSEWQKLK